MHVQYLLAVHQKEMSQGEHLLGMHMLVSCVPMREQKTMRKGTVFQAGQYAALSSFRIGKMLFL